MSVSRRPDLAAVEPLFLAETALIDTRAPIEFEKGSVPGAVNLPLMTDEERAQVGTCYKRDGQAAALALGHRLVSGEKKAMRVAAWKRFAEQHPEGYLFCFRGGLRSAICKQWLKEAGIDYPRVPGGYKAMRRFLIDRLESLSETSPLIILAGHTGAAKTVLLRQLSSSIDLEALAHHRGSAFGKRVASQPSQIDFENQLAVALLRQQYFQAGQSVILEDESRLIGRCALPPSLLAAMSRAPIVCVEAPFEERLEHSFQNYVLEKLTEWQAYEGEEAGFNAFAGDLRASLWRIRKRLGGERYRCAEHMLERAVRLHQEQGDPSLHRDWIALLLKEYYDPMYDYQIRLKHERIAYRGSRDAVLTYLQNTQ